MHGYAIGRSNLFRFFAAVFFGGLCAVMFLSRPASAQSMVQATICGAGAEIALAEPQSDSVITSPTVGIKGSVKQAGQIEVTIDGAFDSVIPLNSGQTTFDSSVQISQGTHTIKLTAIDACGTVNADASVVVTFTPPPSSGSTGENTVTGVDSSGGVAIGTTSPTTEVNEYNPGGLLPAPIADGLNKGLQWLNIAPSDSSGSGLSQLSLGRAAIITLGVYMSFIGVAQTITTAVAATPLFHRVERPDRLRVAGRTFRIIGILLIIAAFVF